MHHPDYRESPGLAERIEELKQAGKVRSLCLIRHYLEGQRDYAANGPDPDADADLVIYNYVCRWQEPGLRKSLEAGTGVLIMKSLGGQWISWEDKAATDWEAADESRVIELSPRGREYPRGAAPGISHRPGPLARAGRAGGGRTFYRTGDLVGSGKPGGLQRPGRFRQRRRARTGGRGQGAGVVLKVVKAAAEPLSPEGEFAVWLRTGKCRADFRRKR